MKLTVSIVSGILSWLIILGMFISGVSLVFDVSYNVVATFPLTIVLSVISGIVIPIIVGGEVYDYLENRANIL